jgi:predicted short-subunit dehydrogenase-like oxidoreductase (DUF2520 family)
MALDNHPTEPKPVLSFIGAGSVGTAFATALQRRGYPIASIVSSRIASSKRLSSKVKAPIASTLLADLSSTSQVVFITTPDQEIAVTAQSLATLSHLDFPTMIFVHASGALGSDVLSPVAKKGGHILSLHPIQLFPRGTAHRHAAGRLSKIYYGLEGDEAGIATGRILVTDLGGKVLLIPRELKPLYHVACVIASNYLVALMSLLEEISGKLELGSASFMDVFDSLIVSTLDAVRASSPREALTGPIERGDVRTVRLHLRELNRTLPYLIPFYTVMGMETIRLAIKKGTLSTKQAGVLLEAMSGYVRKEATGELISHYQEHRN